MRVLGIETSAQVGSVALLEIGGDGAETRVEERSFEKGLRHGRDLVPTIDALAHDWGLQPDAIDLFAVSQGPGSYTGIRVGVTCAKTLAYSLGKPVVGVPSLDVLASNAPRAGRVCAALDAKRKRVYFCTFRREDADLAAEAPYRALPVAEAAAAVQPGDFVIGDALQLYAREFAARTAVLAEEALWLPHAAFVARLGARKLRLRGADDTFALAPIYLHRPEAEEVWERKHGGEA